MPELPPPLPPEQRTVGQVVAESIRAYGARFWLCLPLGLPLAVAEQAIIGRGIDFQIVVLCLFAPLFTVAFVAASLLVLRARPPRRRLLYAGAVGVLVWLLAPVLPALAWLALFGLAVPVALVEPLGLRATLRRARQLAAADYVHALGSLCTLVIVVSLSAGVLTALLHGQAETARRVAAFLALLVLSPLLYLGSALLYVDQAARLVSRRDADLHPALDPDPTGRPDAQVEP